MSVKEVAPRDFLILPNPHQWNWLPPPKTPSLQSAQVQDHMVKGSRKSGGKRGGPGLALPLNRGEPTSPIIPFHTPRTLFPCLPLVTRYKS